MIFKRIIQFFDNMGTTLSNALDAAALYNQVEAGRAISEKELQALINQITLANDRKDTRHPI